MEKVSGVIMNLRLTALILGLLILGAVFASGFGVDKPNIGGSTNWGSTGWSTPQTYGLPQTPIPGQRGGMNMPRGITNYYVLNTGWDEYAE